MLKLRRIAAEMKPPSQTIASQTSSILTTDDRGPIVALLTLIRFEL